MARNKSRAKKISMDDANVNITALMDVLTVLLFFLIKSLTVNSLTLETAKGIRLPSSTVDMQAEESIQVAMSDKEVKVGTEVIMTLQNGKFKPSEIDADGRTLIPLKKYLDKQIQKKYGFYGEDFDLSKLPPAQILIQADKELKFQVVKYMLHTVTVAGYQDYQFVVVPEEGS